MRVTLPTAALLLMSSSVIAVANDSVMEAMANPGNWAIQTGDYANMRFSELNEITAENVGNLQVAWTFSTGVLRGHEGGPLVIDNMMYVHTPFPNNVFALDLANEGRIVWRYEPRQDPDVVAVMC
jgi:glucose dehydrogenase